MSRFAKNAFTLSSSRRALFEKLLKEKGVQLSSSQITPRKRDGHPLRLSFDQERLWVLTQLDPDGYLYTVEAPARLRGRLSVAALWQSFDEIFRRHESLRTTFAVVDGEPVQIIAPALSASLPVVDLQGLPAGEREQVVERLANDYVRQPFDLTAGPLLRAGLLKLNAEEYVLLLAMHHIISDAWSMSVLVQDLSALYEAFLKGLPSPLAALPIQYADYALWQREWLQGSGVRSQGTTPLPPPAGGGTEGGAETRRQGDREQGVLDSQSPIPNPQSPIPSLPSPIPHPPSPMEAQLAYWKRQLGGNPPVLELPLDHPRPAIQTFRGAIRRFTLPKGLTEALKVLSNQAEATPFMTLLAAFATQLYRYTGQETILAGTPIANRHRAETEGLIGFFVNTLVMPIDLTGNPRFRELLGRVREMALGAYAHQDVPFEQIVEELQLERDLSRTALFQVLFTFHNVPRASIKPTVELFGLDVSPLEVDNRTAKFDLSLELEEIGGRFDGIFEYNTDLFDETTIARMEGHYRTLLADIAADPGRRLMDAALLTEAERRQLLVDFNPTGVQFPLDCFAHALFADRARAQPDATAAVFGREHVTYAPLNRRANRLAHWMLRQGLGRGAPVAVFGERGIELLVVLLATLKTGAVYIPLDPIYPDARLITILGDCGARLIATQASMIERTLGLARALNTPLVFCWDTVAMEGVADRRVCARQPAVDPSPGLDGRDLANVFYTSGSTGVPKGAMVEQIGMLNHLWAKIDLLELNAGSVIAQTAAHSFDISIWQYLAPLIAGGRMIIYDNDIVLDQLRFLRAIQRDRVTVVETVPTLLGAMLEAIAAWPGAQAELTLPALTHMISNAETLSVPLCRQWMERFPHVPLVNTYGATECSDDTTHHLMRVPPDGPRVPVGRPIAGLQIYVLDRQLQPVPIGCPGEIAMAGVGLGRGYLNQPDLTAECFIPNPFAGGMGDGGWGMEDATPIPHPPSPIPRLYKTGDLGRWTADGLLDFLGRVDQQVKIRGRRVELGEIEAALEHHPSVRSACVIAREDPSGNTWLVAYVVPTTDHRPPTTDEGPTTKDQRLTAVSLSPQSSVLSPQSLVSELRGFLKERLPDYMIPALFVTLDSMPLTPNGKIDRSALPAPAESSPGAKETYVAPRTVLESLLAETWAEVLGGDQPGIHDDFFELGGNSLHAVRVITRINAKIDAKVNVAELFLHRTVESLAARIAHLARTSETYQRVPITAGPEQARYELSHAQRRFWFIDQMLEGQDKITYSCSIGISIKGHIDVQIFDTTWEYLFSRHAALRTVFVDQEGAPRALIKQDTSNKMLLYDLQGFDAEHAKHVIAETVENDRTVPFSLSKGPLVRIKLFQLADDLVYLYLNMHHIITDGWSSSVLINDFVTAYEALVHGHDIPLALLPVQYTDYVTWEQRMEAAGLWKDKEAYLLKELKKPLPALKLPLDFPKSDRRSHSGGQIVAEAGAETYKALMQVARAYDTSLFIVTLTAYFILLNHLTQQDDIIVAFPVAGRHFKELEHLVGLFINTLVVRINFEECNGVEDLLKQVNKKALHAYESQDYPFDLLVKKVNPERKPAESPQIFSTMFAMQNFPADRSTLLFERVTVDMKKDLTNYFDLSVTAFELGDTLGLTFGYNTELFQEKTIQTISAQYLKVLDYLISSIRR